MCDKFDRIVCRNHAAVRYTVGIFECLRCHEQFESPNTGDEPERCPVCGYYAEIQRIEVRSTPCIP